MDTLPGNSIVREFETKIANYLGAKHCLSVCNATIGIMGVFYSLSLTNSEIITTPLSWSGAYAGLKLLNCKLRFCDVDKDNLTIDPDKLESLISRSTKAVFSADFLGYPAGLDRIRKICDKHNILLIHDAASSFGTQYKDHYSGYFAHVAILSFGARKIFSIGEGGCIVTDDDAIFEKISCSILHQERQATELNSFNNFALNTNLNPLAAHYGLLNFDRRIDEIRSRQIKIKKILKRSRIFNPKNGESPNFHKILVSIDKINEIDMFCEDLPFESTIYDDVNYWENDNIFHNCPIAENAFNNFKIINIRS